VARLRSATDDELPERGTEERDAVHDRYELLSSYEMNAMGLIRYLQRRQESAASRSATS
jgi:hypothetical protein